MAILMGREDAEADRYKKQMKKIRRGRKNLKSAVTEAVAEEVEHESAVDDASA